MMGDVDDVSVGLDGLVPGVDVASDADVRTHLAAVVPKRVYRNRNKARVWCKRVATARREYPGIAWYVRAACVRGG